MSNHFKDSSQKATKPPPKKRSTSTDSDIRITTYKEFNGDLRNLYEAPRTQMNPPPRTRNQANTYGYHEYEDLDSVNPRQATRLSTDHRGSSFDYRAQDRHSQPKPPPRRRSDRYEESHRSPVQPDPRFRRDDSYNHPHQGNTHRGTHQDDPMDTTMPEPRPQAPTSGGYFSNLVSNWVPGFGQRQATEVIRSPAEENRRVNKVEVEGGDGSKLFIANKGGTFFSMSSGKGSNFNVKLDPDRPTKIGIGKNAKVTLKAENGDVINSHRVRDKEIIEANTRIPNPINYYDTYPNQHQPQLTDYPQYHERL